MKRTPSSVKRSPRAPDARECLSRRARSRKRVVQRVGDRCAGLDHEPRPKPRHHGRQAAQVIGVGVGDDRERQATGRRGAARNGATTRRPASLWPVGARVHQDPMPGRCPEHRGIALPDVEKM